VLSRRPRIRLALELLKANPETLSSMLNDEQTMEFIKLHSSWRNVALAEYKIIEHLLTPKAHSKAKI